MARYKDANWNLPGSLPGTENAQLAVLMDIRDELKQLNRTLGCHNVVGGMRALQRMDKRLLANGLLIKGAKR